MNDPLSALTRRDVILGSAALAVAVAASPSVVLTEQATSATTSSAPPPEGLAKRLSGELVLPGDDRYDGARELWNGMIDKHPAAIARCTGVADVLEIVRYARENDWPISVRGGGHNVAGKALRDGAIAVDLSSMDGIRIDPKRRRGRAQGGSLWREFDRETTAFDLVTTGGTVSTTGIAGLTLGGGLGWLMRKYGLSCDGLKSADVVTADGHLLKASAEENPDLFWALRGGGGNFGVVTSFEFGLHPLEPIVGGLALYPENRLRDMFHFFRDYTESAPDTVSAQCGILLGAEGTPVAGQHAGWFGVCHIGPAALGERLVRPVKEFGPPVADFIGPTTYAAIQTMFDAGMTRSRNYWRSNFMTELTDEAIDVILAHADGLPKPGSLFVLEHMQGAISRVGQHETAFSNRAAKYNASILSAWFDREEDERNIAWTRTFGDVLEGFATGAGYVNYMTADEGAKRIRATYEANLARLRKVKKEYDPENFFASNQNIAP